MTIPVSPVQASVFSLHVLSVNVLSQRRAAALLEQQQDFSCPHVNITKPVVSHAGNKELCRQDNNLAIANRSDCQLRTQYVESINCNPVTLKSRLRVIQSHWKWNYCINHTQLTISRVI